MNTATKPTAEIPSDLSQAFGRLPNEIMATRAGFSLIVSGRPKMLKRQIQDEIYRIGREALVNAIRHSDAANLEVEIEYAARRLRLMVRDDGGGIDPHSLLAARGLSTMRDRTERIGGRFSLWSGFGAGTEVEVSVPGEIAFDVA